MHRVLPDGCADIIYTRAGSESTLRFVGPMTRYEDISGLTDSISIGVRFRPAMWHQVTKVDPLQAADQILAVDSIWGKTGAQLQSRLDSTNAPKAAIRLLTDALQPKERQSPVQQAIQWLENSHGNLSLAELAKATGLSTRQFRRRCIALTALPPKFLARILRFRQAQTYLTRFATDAEVALACGYFDQSHLIAEFREFSGRTPRDYRNL